MGETEKSPLGTVRVNAPAGSQQQFHHIDVPLAIRLHFTQTPARCRTQKTLC
jgi:hypothetical protein